MGPGRKVSERGFLQGIKREKEGFIAGVVGKKQSLCTKSGLRLGGSWTCSSRESK